MLVFGFVKPKVALPSNFQSEYSKAQQQLIIEHEYRHFQRGDLFWNLCALALLCMFWFHPLAWFAFRLFKRDQELSCDDTVLVNKTPYEKQQYARALLHAVNADTSYTAMQSFGHFGDKTMIKERIQQLRQSNTNNMLASIMLMIILSLMVSGKLSALDDSSKIQEQQIEQTAVESIQALQPIERFGPRYPQKAAEEGVEGYVVLEFGVTTEGTVENIVVIDSSPKGVFDEEARKALAKWRYSPHTMEGEMSTIIQMDFILDSASKS